MTKTTVVVSMIVIAALVSIAFSQQQPEPAVEQEPGRYQMKLATSDLGNATVYVIDTATSQVWQQNRSSRDPAKRWITLGNPAREDR